MITKQDTFDTVVAHARKQGCKSVYEGTDHCQYRGPNGTKCFVGCLIPEEYNHEIQEGSSVAVGTLMRSLIVQLGHDPVLAQALQVIHDRYEVVSWEEYFSELANKWSLDYTPPEEN